MALTDDWTFDENKTTGEIEEYHYRETPDSGTASLGDNATAERIFLIRGDQLAEFCDDLVGYPAQTLLLLSIDPVKRMPRLGSGDLVWDLAFTFECRGFGSGISGEQAGVNYIFDFANNRWDLITSSGSSGGQRLYKTSDFSQLFYFQA